MSAWIPLQLWTARSALVRNGIHIHIWNIKLQGRNFFPETNDDRRKMKRSWQYIFRICRKPRLFPDYLLKYDLFHRYKAWVFLATENKINKIEVISYFIRLATVPFPVCLYFREDQESGKNPEIIPISVSPAVSSAPAAKHPVNQTYFLLNDQKA